MTFRFKENEVIMSTKFRRQVKLFLKESNYNNIITYWAWLTIVLCVVGGFVFKNSIEYLSGFILCSFIIPGSILLVRVIKQGNRAVRLIWGILGIQVCAVLTIMGGLLFWKIEPYVVTYPNGISEVDDKIIRMDFKNPFHVYQVSVGNRIVKNRLQEIHAQLNGVGYVDRTYLTNEKGPDSSFLDILTDDTRDIPIIAALSLLGDSPTFSEVYKLYVSDTYKGEIKNGDILFSVNDHRIGSLEKIMTNQSSQTITLDITREKTRLKINTTTEDLVNALRSGDVIARSVVILNEALPITLQFNKQSKGNSNGLPIALEIINQKSGDIVKGRIIVATGGIEPDGTITSVGGLDYKLIALSNSEFDIFLVPEKNRIEVEKYLSMGLIKELSGRVVFVNTLEEAVNCLVNE